MQVPRNADSTRPRVRDAVRSAAADYRWLLDRGYPDKPAIKLVGDRYRLSREERGMLFRGVFSGADSARRAERLIDPRASRGKALTVDGYNVLFTVWNYLAGRPVVAATDCFVRDIGGTRSRLPNDHRFMRIAGTLCRAIRQNGVEDITVLLDEQLPWSRDHTSILAAIWNETESDPTVGAGVSTNERFRVFTESGVDGRVARTDTGLIATSDTGIIDRCPASVFDLGGYIVCELFRVEPIVLLPV